MTLLNTPQIPDDRREFAELLVWVYCVEMNSGGVNIEKKIRRENRQKMILDMIAGAGVLTIAVLAPNALKGVGMLQKMFKRPRDPESTYRAFQRLKEKGYLQIKTIKGRTRIEITHKGRVHLAHLGGATAPKQKRWDGYWRMVAYDISEKRKTQRLLLQEALQNTGFYRLQNSVWVYPHACNELVVMLKTEFQLGKEVLYMVVKHLEGSKKLAEHFKIEKT